MAIIPPLGAVGASPAVAFEPAVRPLTSPGSADEKDGVDFGTAVVNALENLQASHATTDRLAEAAATGDLRAVEDYMVMATETQLATQLTVAVRNRAVESFNEIMRMQV
ncbi:flagellar hook-basal body complex protein FliE [Actinomarinicola tropica]|uniref:Flagellar hook-basal body complex protein FliE n=1 Tax=Actinomarinicola tropica TaxID=2789776 RepID=A0A5Q2RID3_9ACTN|nr:flagellar hook-basal body complex protein FliE [Actinomarinicola tropica]QGG94642.1 flagellar hook-basal body protein FliE [Actinomarinicola tropica]